MRPTRLGESVMTEGLKQSPDDGGADRLGNGEPMVSLTEGVQGTHDPSLVVNYGRRRQARSHECQGAG